MPSVRKGQGPPHLDRVEFGLRFRQRFFGPAFHGEAESIHRLEDIAWDGYKEGRKAPVTRAAGPGYKDPSYALSEEWLVTRELLDAAAVKQRDPAGNPRVLLICGSHRNDATCPGEMSKTWRLVGATREALEDENAHTDVDLLDLSLLTSEYGRQIHPCKGCVSTAMPLCHWPCTCYPNHALGQTSDWMAEIYERWVLAHGIIIVTPVYWYQTPSALKLMIDRLVCADGGNPDPTSTQGKDPAKAKKIELAGWDYPKHLAGRAYGIVVHGDVEGIEGVRQALSRWLDSMDLIPAGSHSQLDRFIGYYEPYATSHEALDRDEAMIEETRNVARAVSRTVAALRTGEFVPPDGGLKAPRPK